MCKDFAKLSASIVMPDCLASSDIFKASTAGIFNFLICNTSESWRSICELLSNTITKSTALLDKKCLTTCSSSEKPCKSYIPGKSINAAIWPPMSILALIKSTVIPGQLPTRAEAPLMRLKRVDLPVLGIPNNAMRFMSYVLSIG